MFHRVSTTGGVHVHEGRSCSTTDSQKGHYFDVVDPWFNTENPAIAPDGTGYETNDEGETDTEFEFDQGFGYDDTKGRVVVIHDTVKSAGGDYARVACGKLE